MLRLIRIILAAVFFTGVTLLLLDISGALHACLGWMAKLQLLPAILASNLVIAIGILLMTLLFGRIYCSTICPLGVYQDVVSHISSRKNKRRFSFTPSRSWLRATMLIAFIAASVVGLGWLVGLLAPYANWARIVTEIFQPLYALVNNFFAWIAGRAGSYAFYSSDVWLKSLPALIFAVLMFGLITFLSWKHGRAWCGNICPVGTVLGLISEFSLFKPTIDTDKCVDCGLCGKSCKASCIDTKNHAIDYSRCVSCFDCIDSCHTGALKYRLTPWRKAKTLNPFEFKYEKSDPGRRAFVAGTALLAGTALAKAQDNVNGGLAGIAKKKAPKRTTPLYPAGSISDRNFTSKCIACGLCISKCPNGVLRPSSDLRTLMQPEMSYERGFCRPECTACSEVCPTGAITEITREKKSSIQIGHAVWVEENCLPLTDGVECGNCFRHCPAGAIHMVKIGDTPLADKYFFTDGQIPVVNEDRCIGCGACENLCPSRPVSAIYVEGHKTHKEN
ncbi:MAG: 4Fe-4S binding protein [Bacteroidales bacterium]|nr:4Fe-4S binding protein [Bacteroidales bacterium]